MGTAASQTSREVEAWTSRRPWGSSSGSIALTPNLPAPTPACPAAQVGSPGEARARDAAECVLRIER